VHFRNQALPRFAGSARRGCTVAHLVGRIVVGTGSLLDRDDPDGMPRRSRQRKIEIIGTDLAPPKR